MARKKVSQELEEDEPTLDISSMVDVCFLLLIYFLVTTTIQPREQDLKMTLPAAAPSTEVPDIAPMFIKVNKSGAVTLGLGDQAETLDTDADSRELPMLKERLDVYVSGVKAADKEPVVQIWVDNEAVQQRVIDVMNCLASANIKSITFTDLVDK